MATPREMRLRIRSVQNIAQVTHALEAVSASRVRRAEQAVLATRPYATKGWDVLRHLARQPGRNVLHPLLSDRPQVRQLLALLITSDRGLCGAYNSNIVRFALAHYRDLEVPVRFIVVGRKGRDMLVRRRVDLLAEFSHLPTPPSFADVSAVGRLVVEEYLQGRADRVDLFYTDYVSLIRQDPTYKQLLPLQLEPEAGAQDALTPLAAERRGPEPAYIYEPSEEELLDFIIPRLTAIQVYQAILESQASEHAARMIAMRNATDNAKELVIGLTLEYNKARQQAITSEMLDIAGGVEALRRAEVA